MININSVSKNFEGNKVIKNISIKIDEGEIVGLLGPNGAGKTTSLRMIAGVLPPSSGMVKINGKNLFDPENSKKPHIGYLPENNPIFDDMTVEEFLWLWADLKGIDKEKQKEEIEKAVMDTGLNEVYYRPIAELSKGFRQRTGLAQAILSDPDILLLDEPTEGLDPNQRRDIHKLLKSLGKKRTVIISSHVLSEITKMCSRIVIINNGKIVADCATEELGNISGKGSTFEIVLKGEKIEEKIKKIKEVKSVEKIKERPAFRYIIKTKDEKDLRLELFDLAKKNNWDLYELSRKQEDLEDIFAQLTKDK